MNRRKFLRVLGLAPVAAALSVMVRQGRETSRIQIKSTVDMDYAMGSVALEQPLIFNDGRLHINLAHIEQII